MSSPPQPVTRRMDPSTERIIADIDDAIESNGSDNEVASTAATDDHNDIESNHDNESYVADEPVTIKPVSRRVVRRNM